MEKGLSLVQEIKIEKTWSLLEIDISFLVAGLLAETAYGDASC